MHRPRSREKPRRVTTDQRPGHGCSSPFAGRSLAEGNLQSKTWKKVNTVHDPICECGSVQGDDLITLEFKSYSKKVGGMPIKTLIDEEMTREKHTRRSPPSLIARLMGLDTLPSPGPFKSLKEVRSSSKNVLSKEFLEPTIIKEDHESSNDEHQEFKDVFEVVQVPKVEKQKCQIVRKEVTNLRQHEIDKEFIHQSSSEAIGCSANRIPQTSKVIADSVDTLDHEKEIYPPFLQEPSKHLLNPALSPSSPKVKCTSVLLSSNGSPTASCHSSFRSEKNVDSSITLKGDDLQSIGKLGSNCYSHPSREHMRVLLQKLSESEYAEKDGYCTQPTQIVILKPSLEKARKAERTIPSAKCLNSLQYNLKDNMKFPVDEIMKLYIEERMGRTKFLDKVESMGPKPHKSRENVKELTKQLRSTVVSDRQKVSVDNFIECVKNKSLITTSGTLKGKNSNISSNSFEYSDSSSRSVDSPTESSVTMEARKRLSERWKLTNHFQEMDILNRTSNTLAEMLALSDNETPKVTLSTFDIKKGTGKKLDREGLFEPRNHPLGISSKDGWKDDFCKSPPRPKSIPASTRGNYHLKSENRQGKVNRIIPKKVEDRSNSMSPDNDSIRQKNTLRNLKYPNSKDVIQSEGKENALAEREIHVSLEELKNGNDSRFSSVKQHIAIELLDDSTDRSAVTDKFSVPQSKTNIPSLKPKESGFQQLEFVAKSESSVKLLECVEHECTPKEALVYLDEDQLPAAHCNKIVPVSPGSYNDADQPSPVSVLEVPFEEEEEDFSTGCFEKISAHLNELRMQLRLLKLESANGSNEVPETNSSEEDTDILQSFGDEEERNYSYVLDILVDCEALKSELDGILTDHPIELHVFERLEKKYKLHDSWSRSDRKLLFDVTTCSLAEIFERNGHWKAKVVRKSLVEEVWKMVVKQMDNSGENMDGLSWAGSGDGEELVGRKVEEMVEEDLVEELVNELASLIVV